MSDDREPFGSAPASDGALVDAVRAAVLVLPAISTPPRAYGRVVAALADSGISARVMRYGCVTARNEGGGVAPSTFAQLADNSIPQALAQLRVSFPGVPVWILGHSLGAQISVLAAQRSDLDIDGLCFIAGGTPYHREFEGLSKVSVLAATSIASGISTVLGHWPGTTVRMGTNEPAALVRDWRRLAWSGRYEKLAGVGPAERLEPRRYRGPLLAVSIRDDNLAPRTAVEALCRHVPDAQLITHELERGGHLGWLRSPEAAIDIVVDRIRAESAENGER